MGTAEVDISNFVNNSGPFFLSFVRRTDMGHETNIEGGQDLETISEWWRAIVSNI